jgi:chorismate mutase
MLRGCFRNRAAFGDANRDGTDSAESQSTKRKWVMTEQEQRLANERNEIADRVANFKAMQARFQREREVYCTTTLRNACEGKAVSYWR